MATSTQLPGLTSGIAPIAGSIGEQLISSVAIGSLVSLTDATAANLTSLSLTAGVWDVTMIGIYGFTVPTAGQYFIASISPTSATLSSNDGNSRVSANVNTGWIVSQALVLPAVRVTLSATTTYYAVAFASFAAGTANIYGRLSAVRVG